MEFEWDENKNKANQEKHNIDFDFACKVFEDNSKIEWEDIRIDYGEQRFITLGKYRNTLLTVVYTIRETKFRLISARAAKKQERNIYNLQN